jgi:hypothetical protein
MFFGAAVVSAAAWLPACFADPLDPGPGGVCCDAACVASAGSYTFVSEGQPAEVFGSVSITDTATGEMLLTREMDGRTALDAMLGNFDLQAYEGGSATLRIDVIADGFEETSQEVTIDVQHTEICCDSCSTSSDSFEIALSPTG